MMKKISCAIVFLIMLLSVAAQEETYLLKGKPYMYVPFSAVKPLIDGKLSDEIWLKAYKFQLNKMSSVGPIPYYKTTVMTYSDKSNLYISFECIDKRMDKVGSVGSYPRDDKRIFKEDYAMMTFSLEKKKKSSEVLSIMVAANGAIRDAKGENVEWNCEGFEHVIVRSKNSWTLEMSIPLKSLFGKSKSSLKAGLRVNLFRVRPEKSWDEEEVSSWVPDKNISPKESKEFGYLFMQAFSAQPGGVIKNVIVHRIYKGLPALEIKMVDKKFVVDGDIEEQIKEGVMPIGFNMLRQDPKNLSQKPKNKTKVWLLTTKLALVICIRNYESSMDKLRAVKNLRDKINWDDDINEIFINIGEGAGKEFYQIGVDCEGTLYDSFNGKPDWNGKEIQVATKKYSDHWDVELVIPFDNLSMKKVRASWKKPWRINLSRLRPVHEDGDIVEETAWSPTNAKKSGIPAKFGYIFMEVIGAKLPK